MKIKYFIVTVISLMAMSILTGFYTNQDGKAKVQQDDGKQAHQGVKNAKTGFNKEWQQFKSDAELKINANEKRINEFKVKIKTARQEVKADYDREITLLEQKNVELKKKINEFKYEGKDKWEEFKQGFNRDMDIVGKALKDLWSKKD
jgi:hypothetical protein